ncbi:MAG: PfkB domain protein [Chthoniobacteraceae bacterium]|nr:PfkB domain protein [Chthoniobacteraceae bacterium]
MGLMEVASLNACPSPPILCFVRTQFMTPRKGILAAGNWIIDHVKVIDTWPAQDALANIFSRSRGTGGSPYNILVDLARMQTPFPLEALGLVGDDEDGASIFADCAQRSIGTVQLQKTAAAPTSYTDVMSIQGTGRRTFFHARGANALLDSEHFDFSKSGARIFHLGYLLLLDRLDGPSATHGTVAAEILSRAQLAGLKTSIDVVSEDSDRFAKIVLPALPHVDLCIMNEFEAGRVTGRQIRVGDVLDRTALRQAMAELIAAGVRERVVVHFPEGACALGVDGAWHEHGSVRLPDGYIKGAAGAGDAFTAGVLLGWHEGNSIEECLRFGVCAAAANLSDATCTGGLKPLEQCLALGTEFGFR